MVPQFIGTGKLILINAIVATNVKQQFCKMSEGYQIRKQDAAHFLTMTVVEWLDVFSREENKILLCESLNYCTEKKGLEIYAYVIMSNHIHLLARARERNLSDIVRDFKKFTSGKLISKIRRGRESRKEWMLEILTKKTKVENQKSTMQLWQYENHPIEIYSPKWTKEKIQYIHFNPVEEGVVQKPENYKYSSAFDYAGGQGPVKISLINLHNLN